MTQEKIEELEASLFEDRATIRLREEKIMELTATAAAYLRARVAELEGLQKMIDGVKEEATAEGRGFWKPCTGCHEAEMGQTTLGGWSKMFRCEQGVGCLECGGLGVLWDSEDYEDMAEWMRQEDKKEAGRKAELTALRARVAELEAALKNIDRMTYKSDGDRREMIRARVHAALKGAPP